MKPLITFIAVVFVLILIIAATVISTKNGLIDRDEAVQASWAQIETQLQRRADLIPNLVATVKGYANHEQEIFTEIANARSQLLSAKGVSEKASANSVLSGALGKLLAISEAYPTLKADSSFVRLQDELAGTENRITVARTRYNDSVKIYNAAIRKFPGSLFASDMGLEPAEHYNPPNIDTIEQPPTVEF
jgi:LemA protein